MSAKKISKRLKTAEMTNNLPISEKVDILETSSKNSKSQIFDKSENEKSRKKSSFSN